MPPPPSAADCLAKLTAMSAEFQASQGPVNFYSTNEIPFGVFSNFYPSPLVFHGVHMRTAEHVFQCYKFIATDKASFDEIVAADNCMTVTKIGRDRSRPLRADWDAFKIPHMFDVCTAKFLQHDDLLQILMRTAGKTLVEHTKNDNFWGDGLDADWEKNNRNWLGRTLMRLRDALAKTTVEERKEIDDALRTKGVNPLRERLEKQEEKAAAANQEAEAKAKAAAATAAAAESESS